MVAASSVSMDVSHRRIGALKAGTRPAPAGLSPSQSAAAPDRMRWTPWPVVGRPFLRVIQHLTQSLPSPRCRSPSPRSPSPPTPLPPTPTPPSSSSRMAWAGAHGLGRQTCSPVDGAWQRQRPGWPQPGACRAQPAPCLCPPASLPALPAGCPSCFSHPHVFILFSPLSSNCSSSPPLWCARTACRRGANLYRTAFSDAAPSAFPVNAVRPQAAGGPPGRLHQQGRQEPPARWAVSSAGNRRKQAGQQPVPSCPSSGLPARPMPPHAELCPLHRHVPPCPEAGFPDGWRPPGCAQASGITSHGRRGGREAGMVVMCVSVWCW